MKDLDAKVKNIPDVSRCQSFEHDWETGPRLCFQPTLPSSMRRQKLTPSSFDTTFLLSSTVLGDDSEFNQKSEAASQKE